MGKTEVVRSGMMRKSNKNKVYEAYDELIDWFDAHRNKELHMEQFYLHQIKNISLMVGVYWILVVVPESLLQNF